MTAQLAGLPPLVSRRTRLLIVGSFPSAASLQSGQYYANPKNQFWRILQAILPSSPINISGCSYEIRSKWLFDKQLGLWDVYATCQREGSLDSRIRQAVLNDFTPLKTLCPELRAVAHNGQHSARHAALLGTVGLPTYRLPSSSPAYAAMGFERKVAAWRDVFSAAGLLPSSTSSSTCSSIFQHPDGEKTLDAT